MYGDLNVSKFKWFNTRNNWIFYTLWIIFNILFIVFFLSEVCSELSVVRLSRISGSVRGGDEVFLLCSKIKKGLFKIQKWCFHIGNSWNNDSFDPPTKSLLSLNFWQTYLTSSSVRVCTEGGCMTSNVIRQFRLFWCYIVTI